MKHIVTAVVLATMLLNQAVSQKISGKWRGEFTIQDSIAVPFNFEIDKSLNLILINGGERLNAGKAAVREDSVIIPLDQFDNLLLLKIKDNRLRGNLQRQNGEYLAAVTAERGKTYRFKTNGIRPIQDYSGKYEVKFDNSNETAIGLFTQKGNRLLATFMKPSGDTRFQEGIVEGNRFYLSSFFGSTPAYYTGEFTAGNTLQGRQVGIKTTTSFRGQLNPLAELPDPNQRTKSRSDRFSLSLPDVNGQIVTLDDVKFKNKPVIITITGTWCPNCMDEARFLTDWYRKNMDRGIEVIALHFERVNDTTYARKVMERNRQQFGITYTQLFGGSTSKDDIERALPMLEDFKAFPTLIYLDREHRVVNIHSGFSGPATGKYYDDFVLEFNKIANRLLSAP